jgi:prophage maintenance system killer protein/DNA-binding XRE family transcriptional regulator
MENRNVTFPQTLTILEGVNVSGVSLNDVQAILNMRDAWSFVIDSLDQTLDIQYLCQVQERVAFREALAWGSLRDGAISISGVSYIPPVPTKAKAKKELSQILTKPGTATQVALDVFCWIARSQLFWDGNKRTALLAANKLLITAGAGIMLITDDVMLEFTTLLTSFLETGDSNDIQLFLYTKAICGFETQLTHTQAQAESADRRSALWLKAERKAQNLTQRELAAETGVAISTIANIEQNQRQGSAETWEKLEARLSGG